MLREPWNRELRSIGRRRTEYIALIRRERANDLMESGEVIKYVCFWSITYLGKKEIILLGKESSLLVF